MGWIRCILIACLVAVQIAFGAPEFLLSKDGYWTRALSYSFFHASWWHLAVNSLAVWSIYSPKRSCKPCRDLLFPYIIAVLVYPLSLRPVIGLSNLLYAVLGLRTPPLSSPWWKQTPVVVFLVVTVLMVFIPQVSATTHVAAFLLGVGGAYLNRYAKKVTSDAGRYL